MLRTQRFRNRSLWILGKVDTFEDEALKPRSEKKQLTLKISWEQLPENPTKKATSNIYPGEIIYIPGQMRPYIGCQWDPHLFFSFIPYRDLGMNLQDLRTSLDIWRIHLLIWSRWWREKLFGGKIHSSNLTNDNRRGQLKIENPKVWRILKSLLCEFTGV